MPFGHRVRLNPVSMRKDIERVLIAEKVTADDVGFEIGDELVVGHGLTDQVTDRAEVWGEQPLVGPRSVAVCHTGEKIADQPRPR